MPSLPFGVEYTKNGRPVRCRRGGVVATLERESSDDLLHPMLPAGDGASEVLTVSDACASGLRRDASGPCAVDVLTTWGFRPSTTVVPSEVAAIREAIGNAVAAGARLLVLTGGTGIAPRDVTPDALGPMLDREIPALSEAVRVAGGQSPGALLSRAVAGTIGRSLVVALPGSPHAVRAGLDVVRQVLEHALNQLDDLAHAEER